MGAYHQMGHDSDNLLREPALEEYQGAIISPVNYSLPELTQRVHGRAEQELEMIFDPQLYYPRSERGKLRDWSYFPEDVDTADHSRIAWWGDLIGELVSVSQRIGADALCCPSVVPRIYSDEYYLLNREIGSETAHQLAQTSIQPICTLLVKLEDLGQPDRSAEIASIVSASELNRVYLIVLTDVQPRREIKETEELKGVMRLIAFLENAGMHVLMGFSSSDVVLWKAAGASDCATGKFFNLRRFTPSRWATAGSGGGQLPYWFEESMMAFLRESDLIRVHNAGLLSESSLNNPYRDPIFDKVENGDAWLAESWRYYMYWFANFEERIGNSTTTPGELLRRAEGVWVHLEEQQVLMEEWANDGSWLRPWRRALIEAFSP